MEEEKESQFTDRKCENCLFFEKNAADQGQCRINPPSLFVIPNRFGGVDFSSTWPTAKTDAFCGKFELDTIRLRKVDPEKKLLEV